MSERRFPDGFLWGAATATHQVEGGNVNDWSGWDETQAEGLAADAKNRLGHLPSWDYIQEEAQDPGNYVAGRAADHYHRYEADFDLLEELNLSALRVGIEWARIEPEPGVIDHRQLKHYRDVLESLHKRGITPLVTLHHFTNPQWFFDRDDWLAAEAPQRFADYAEVIARELGDLIPYWITINEPGSYVLMKYLGGDIWPAWPGARRNTKQALRAQKQMIKAHKLARARIKEHYPEAMTSMSHGVPVFEPRRRDPFSILAAKLVTFMGEERMMRALKGHEDFLSLHYYNRTWITSKFAPITQWYEHDDTGQQSDMGWGVYPQGIYEITQAAKKYNVPIIIAENGLPDGRDELREQFIHDHLYWLHRSIEDGADIRGYLHWSLLDNYEWSEGFWPKFGLAEVDRKTMKRRLRPSARAYGRIARANALTDAANDE